MNGKKCTTQESSLQKVQSDLGLGPVSSSLLNIYRWGQQVVDLPADHPALPLTLQMYFLLHLARVPPQPGSVLGLSVIFIKQMGAHGVCSFIMTQLLLDEVDAHFSSSIHPHWVSLMPVMGVRQTQWDFCIPKVQDPLILFFFSFGCICNVFLNI